MEINEMGLKQYNELLVEIKEATDLLKENTSKIADANEVLVKLNDNIKNLDIQITAVNGTLKQTNKEVPELKKCVQLINAVLMIFIIPVLTALSLYVLMSFSKNNDLNNEGDRDQSNQDSDFGFDDAKFL